MKKKLVSLALALALMFSLCPALALAAEGDAAPVKAAAAQEAIVTHIAKIDKHGNIDLDVPYDDFMSRFAYGDVVTVTLGSLSLDLPVVDDYACVAQGEPAVFATVKTTESKASLAINKKSFASEYGVARQPDPVNAPAVWEYLNGFSADTDITISMAEKAGYLAQYTLLSLNMYVSREECPALTDAEYANFRMVTAGLIHEGVLYRSASPVDPKRGRNTYADAAAREAGITIFVDLADGELDLIAFPGFAETYFAAQDRVCVDSTIDYETSENREKLAHALRYMAHHRGVYDVFCLEGKDRTGFVVALLEALMGASYDEIKADYMVTYYNYYGITPDSETYELIAVNMLDKQLHDLLGVDPHTANLQRAAHRYIRGLGLTNCEINRLEMNLLLPAAH